MITHLDKDGKATMVDVSEKQVTQRTATARSIVVLPHEVLAQLVDGDIQTKKGSVFQVAIIAGIMAAKKTGDLIPLCHPLALENCNINISLNGNEVIIDCTATITAKTGVEMEALVGASLAALTIYDMCKAISHDIVIKETRLTKKQEGSMTLKGHKKHTTITRPELGNYGRNEWAIIGGFCTAIKLLADQVISTLSPQYKCAYVDATHSDELTAPPGRLVAGASLEYIDQVNYQQVNYAAEFTAFGQRQLFAGNDIVLVNGNHHQAKAQIVIIDWNKDSSLQKRLDQLTNVQLFILAGNSEDIFDFIKEAIPHWQQIPTCRIDEFEKIIAFFTVKMQQAKPVLNGLVLAGGKSTRMGFDKSKANWSGREQRYHVAGMLKTLCKDVYISRSSEQQIVDDKYQTLTDTFTGLGPYGAILSAFREKPDQAWLIVACDLPLLDMETLRYLVDNRDSSSIATAFGNGFENLPEPLIAIWEPKSYPVLLSFLSQGYSCPRKVLINSDSRLLTAADKSALTNVNTPEDLEKIKRYLEKTTA